MILRNYYYLLSRKWQNVYLSFYLHVHACVCAQSLQPCLTLWHTMDCSPPGSCVHGILQARILVWDAIPSSRGSFGPRDRTCISCISCIGRQILLPLSHLGNPLIYKPIHNFFFYCGKNKRFVWISRRQIPVADWKQSGECVDEGREDGRVSDSQSLGGRF